MDLGLLLSDPSSVATHSQNGSTVAFNGWKASFVGIDEWVMVDVRVISKHSKLFLISISEGLCHGGILSVLTFISRGEIGLEVRIEGRVG